MIRRRRARPREVPKLKCPACGEYESRVIRAEPTASGESYERERRCEWCRFIYVTEERIKKIPAVLDIAS
jgi:transcriptional regulator NrdR family protein